MRLETLLIVAGLAAGAVAATAGLPLHFEENRGQVDGQVRFLARCPGFQLFLTGDQAVLGLPGGTPPVRLSFVGADSCAAVCGRERQPGIVSYFRGDDPEKWVSGAPTFGAVEYLDLYPGIDLLWRGASGGELEFDFRLAPGVDPSVIEMRIEGALEARLNPEEGGLALEVEGGTVTLGAPRVFQDGAPVEASLELRPTAEGSTWLLAFAVAGHDPAGALFIDPVVRFSTYLGGAGGDYGTSVGLDAAGNSYIAGYTPSVDFPTLPTSLAPAYRGGSGDGFVCKLDPTGQTMLYSTYLGGSAWDGVKAMAVDAAGSAVVVGATTSADFPLVGALQPTFHGGNADGFVARLDAAGSSLAYSTFLGGTGNDQVTGIAIGSSGEFVVAGETGSLDFPLVNPLQGYGGGWADAFAAVIAPGGAALSFSTYHGGSLADYNVKVAVDVTGVLHLCGLTESPNLPLANPLQAVYGGNSDGFAAGIVPGVGLAYSTYMGGTGFDLASDVAADADGTAIIVGWSIDGIGFPTTPGALHPTPIVPGGVDMFVTRLAPGGAVVFSTFLGGTGVDFAYSVAVDAHSAIFVGGVSDSADFPLTHPVGSSGGSQEAAILELSPDGAEIRFGTLLGGANSDAIYDLAVDPVGNLLVAGTTWSTDFPLVNPWQPAPAGGNEAFLTRIDRVVHIRSISVSRDPVSPGLSGVTVWMDVENTGASSVQVQATGLRFADASGIDRGIDYVVTPAPGSPMTIAGGATETLALLVDITPGAQLGATSIDGNVQVSDLVSGAGHADHNADAPGSWNVVGGLPFVRVVDSPATSVLQGAPGQPVTVSVENVGVSGINVGALTLTFAGIVDRTSEYTVTPDPGNPTSIAGGATELFSFAVDVSPTATPELIVIDASFTGTDAATMAAVMDPGADTTAAWTVLAGEVFVRTVDTPVATVLQGTSGHPLTVTVENTGGNAMNVSAVTLRFTGAADRSGEYTVTTDPGNPTTIAGGATELFAFTAEVSPSASLESVVLDAGFTGVDAGSLAAVGDADAEVTDSWTVVACLALTCGDCNGDGVQNILDALAAALHSASIVTLVGQSFSNCNVTGLLEPAPGAVVDVLDSLLLAQAAAGLPVTLACC